MDIFDNQTTKLSPCPGCGMDMKVFPFSFSETGKEICGGICHENNSEAVRKKCPMKNSFYDTREEAIAAWNVRSVLKNEVCKMKQPKSVLMGTCLECGKTNYGILEANKHKPPIMCPNCGRRVIK